MDEPSIRRLISHVASTNEDELDCEAAEPWMEEAADASTIPTRLAHHLRRCPACAEIFAALRAAVSLERSASLPSVHELWHDIRAACREPQAVDVQPSATDSPALAPAPLSVDLPAPTPAPTARRRLFAFLAGGGAGSAGRPLVPALLSLIVLLGAAGWWQAWRMNGRLAGMQAVMVEAESFEDMVRLVNRSSFGQADSGAWARIIYHDDLERGMVYAGALPVLMDGQEIACWMVGRDGSKELAWQGVHEESDTADQSWWPVTVSGPLRDYATMIMTVEPTGDVLVEVPFTDPNS